MPAGDDDHAMARTAVRAGAAVFAELVRDRDPEVRRAAATAVTAFLDEPGRVLGLLTERLDEEEDERVRPALAEALGLFARLRPAYGAAAVDLLVALRAAPHDHGLRLAALGPLADRVPGRLPSGLVAVVASLRARSRRPRPADLPERPDTDTPIGQLRRLRPADEEGARLPRTLHTGLGGRTAERIALLNGQLTSGASADRCNAVWMSAGLLREWRGSYEEPVALIGGQLGMGEERLRDRRLGPGGSLRTGPAGRRSPRRPGGRGSRALDAPVGERGADAGRPAEGAGQGWGPESGARARRGAGRAGRAVRHR
ncbi:HEAT repeat domain-containing protein [Streptomyces fagopyri]|uniref:HEAT repeat domain-containing protein n=1 Tax=Streptomyces fagopyri TaxID=2662397 RepID=UPI0033CBE077